MLGFRKAIVFFFLWGLAHPTAAWAQDRVTFYDRKLKKDDTVAGTIVSESPGQVVVKPTAGAGTRDVPAADIVDIIYEVPGRIRPDYTQARGEERKIDTLPAGEERKQALEEVIKNFQKLLRDLGADKQKFAQRHFQFKLARLQARLAEDDPAVAEGALQALTQFKKEHAEGWQIGSCAKLLARLQLDKGDVDAALKTYADLAALPGLTKEARQECEVLSARALIRGKKLAEAEKRLQVILQSLPPEDPQAVRARIHLAECMGASNKLDEAVQVLEELIAKTSDNELKALAFNTLGDCNRYNNKVKEAVWAYLHVDILFHQDKREHTRAIEQLAKLFDELGDKTKAKQYQDKLKGGVK